MDSHAQRRLARIWSFYSRNHCPRLRQLLIEQYLPHVETLARKFLRKLPASVQLDELVSAGILGLMDAVDAFRLDRDTTFETFSAQRIVGAMIDELRAIDPVTRNTRTAARQLETMAWKLQCALGRPPSDEELAGALGQPMKKYQQIRQLVRAASVASLDRQASDSPDERSSLNRLADEHSPDPAHEVQRKGLRDYIVRGLSREERLIVVLYYYENLTLRQIGQVLNISESRVSQVRSSIIRRFKAKWGKAEPEPDFLAA